MIKKRLKILLLCLTGFLCGIGFKCHAQGEGNVWIFGRWGAGIDFNGGAPVAIRADSGFYQQEGCASICNAQGQLLFYSNGAEIKDRNFNIMPNGTLGFAYNQVGSQTQSVVITEIPNTKDKYYVFSNVRTRGLYYSVVDMQLNGGIGDVEEGPVLITNTNLTEKMTIVSGNSCNLWLMVRVWRENYTNEESYLAYEITENGIRDTPVISRTGTLSSYNTGVIKFSPDRSMMVATTLNGVEIYNFDPNTGMLTSIIMSDTIIGRTYGACFSPDNSKLYVGTTELDSGIIFQYDLTQSNIAASRYYVGRDIDGGIGDMQLGSDGKLYLAASFKNWINCINYPNLYGSSCGFQSPAIQLAPGSQCLLGLPNDPGIIQPPDTFYNSSQVLACFTDSIRIGADSSGNTYVWNTGDLSDSITINVPGWYTVGFQKECNYYVDSIHVIFGSGNLPQLYTSDRKSCSYIAQDTAIISLVSSDTFRYTLHWYNSRDSLLKTSLNSSGDTLTQLAPGNYKVNIRTIYGCDTTLSFNIELPLPQEALFSIDSILCQKQTYIFQNTSTGNVNSWRWNFGDGNTAIQQHPEHRYALPGKYRVTLVVANPTPCYDTFSRDIIVDTLGQVSFSTDREELCTGSHVQFIPTYTGALSALYWNFGNNNSLYNIPAEPVQYAYDEPGVYLVTLTGNFRACPDTTYSQTLRVHALPIVDLGEDTALCQYSNAIVIGNRAINQPGYTYTWNTGAATENLEIKNPGIYSLKITSEHGCINTGTIEVKKDCYIDIPNAFTPNGDGVNDYFFPRQLLTQSVNAFHMQIFSRWGEKVFETALVDGRGWDGKVQGKEQPGGVYVYMIDVTFENKKQEKYEGNVTLLR